MKASSTSIHDHERDWPPDRSRVSLEPELARRDEPETSYGSREVSTEPGEYQDASERTEDEDDGPDPDLLVSHEHGD